jgi:hypothetical protein
MQYTRDILMTEKAMVSFRLTFESRDLNAHSLLSGLPETRRTAIEEIMTDTTIKLRDALGGDYDIWNSERR